MSQRNRKGVLRRSGSSRLRDHPNLEQFFRDLEWDRSNQDAYDPNPAAQRAPSLSEAVSSRPQDGFTPQLMQLQHRSRRRARGG